MTNQPFAAILVASATTLGALGALTRPAHADPAGHRRSGATFGVGLGLGHIDCEDADGNDCDGDGVTSAFGLAARAGVMVSRGAALAGEVWGMRHDEGDLDVEQLMITGQVRGWVAPQLWLQGGVGVARTTTRYDFGVGQVVDESDLVPALVGGVGVEVVSDRTFALDLELKAGSGLYRDDLRVYNLALGLGLSFY